MAKPTMSNTKPNKSLIISYKWMNVIIAAYIKQKEYHV